MTQNTKDLLEQLQTKLIENLITQFEQGIPLSAQMIKEVRSLLIDNNVVVKDATDPLEFLGKLISDEEASRKTKEEDDSIIDEYLKGKAANG